MPDNDAYLRLRRMTGEDDTKVTKYSNADLGEFLAQAGGDLNGAASLIWGEKAGTYADLVNMTEAGSSRSNSDLFKHAVEQRDYFQSISVAATTDTSGASTTRRIVRP